jgi:hypothetical protein
MILKLVVVLIYMRMMEGKYGKENDDNQRDA